MTTLASHGRLLVSLSLILCCLQTQAADDIALQFQHPPKGKPVSYFSVEIGGYDVTQFAHFSDTGVTVTVESDLEPGNYEAYVVAYYEDGEVETLTETMLSIAPKSHTQWSINSTLSTQYRVDEDDQADYSNSDHWQSNAAIDGALTYQNGNARVDARIQAIYDSMQQGHVPENQWQLADYQATLSHDGDQYSTGIQVGNNSVEQESLLFSGYQRRSINLFSKRHDDRFKASLFGAVSETTNSAGEDLFWTDEQQNQTVGGTLSFSPISNHPERLIIGASYVDGKGTSAGSGFTVIDSDTVYGGHSWGLSLDSIWMNRALWLHWESAASDFDSDGLEYGDDTLNDNASKFMVQLNSSEELPTLGLDYWQLNLQRQRVGEYFYSIANLALPGDLISHQATFSGGAGSLSFNADLQQQETNESDRSDRATRKMDYRGLDLYYTPTVDTGQGVWSTLGAPSLNAYYHFTKNTQRDGDQLLSGMDIDNTQQEYSIGFTLSHDTWNWGLSYARVDVEDRSEAVMQNAVEIYTPLGDTTNHMTTFQLGWYPNSRFSITPQLQWNRYREKRNGNEQETLNAGFDTQIGLIPRKLTMNLNYFYGRFDNQYGNPVYLDSRQDTHTGNLQLSWKAIEAQSRKPGLDLFLKGSYGRQEDSINTSDYENWQILMGFSVYWSGNNEG